MDRIVIVVNGYAQSGKDTAIGFMRARLAWNDYANSAFSSIDPVRDGLAAMGIDTSRKTNKDRDLLAGIGDLVETYNHYRSNACIQATQRAFVGHKRAVMFLHSREPKVIERVRAGVSGFATFHTVLLSRPDIVKVESNASDRDVETMRYDHYLANDQSLDALKASCEAFVDRLIKPRN